MSVEKDTSLIGRVEQIRQSQLFSDVIQSQPTL